MTKTNKLIVGGVVLVALLFLYDRNEKMKKMAILKAQAQADELAENQRVTNAIKKAQFNRPKGDVTAIGGTMVDLG